MSGSQEDRPATCCLHVCPRSAEVVLKNAGAVKVGTSTSGDTFWFCAAHAIEYERAGYRPLEQGRLV